MARYHLPRLEMFVKETLMLRRQGGNTPETQGGYTD